MPVTTLQFSGPTVSIAGKRSLTEIQVMLLKASRQELPAGMLLDQHRYLMEKVALRHFCDAILRSGSDR